MSTVFFRTDEDIGLTVHCPGWNAMPPFLQYWG